MARLTPEERYDNYRPPGVPQINMSDPIPDYYLRNLPRWVSWLQFAAYLMMLPYGLLIVWLFFFWPLAQRMGLM
jgi:hypothetical protein